MLKVTINLLHRTFLFGLAMAAGELDDRSLQEIPTWAVALVCAVFIIISISIEHGILSLGKVY